MQSEATAQTSAPVSHATATSLRPRMGEGAIVAAFAGLLAAVTWKHSMYLDEAQAWLIARCSLPDLFHQLHYEAHPAAWYLLLYLPAHLSSHMQWIEAINFTLSLGMAWLIVTARKVPVAARGLLLFTPVLFFAMGTLARSYMLAGVLLVGAARCLVAERPRPWLTIGLLAVAINTHFFAIPVAGAIFVFLYWFAPTQPWATGRKALHDSRFFASAGVLFLALVACYFTIRPAKDIYLPQYHAASQGIISAIAVTLSHIWYFFTAFGLDRSGGSGGNPADAWTASHIQDALLAIGAWVLGIAVLPSRRARWFFISISIAWLAAVTATVRVAQQTHCTFLIIGFAIALILGAYEGGKSWLPSYAVHPLLLVFLGVQIPLTVFFVIKEFREPFSGAKATADWLKSAGLVHRAIVIEPAISAPAVVGYLGIRSVFLPNCNCQGSFLEYRGNWATSVQVTRDQLSELRHVTGFAPVVLSNWEISAADTNNLGLKLEFESPKGWDWNYETFYVYEAREPGMRDSGESLK
jgi:hypothetical protein